jgi:hypothetical protein
MKEVAFRDDAYLEQKGLERCDVIFGFIEI